MVIVEAAHNPIVLNEANLIYKAYQPIVTTSENIRKLVNKLVDEDINLPNKEDQKALDEFLDKYGDDLKKFANSLPKDKSKVYDPMEIVLNIVDFLVSNILISLLMLIPLIGWIPALILGILNLIGLVKNFIKISANKDNVRKAEEALYKINSQLKKIDVNKIKDKRIKEKIIDLKEKISDTADRLNSKF